MNPSVWYQTLALVSACSCATLENLRTGERGSPFQIDKQPLGNLFVKEDL